MFPAARLGIAEFPFALTERVAVTKFTFEAVVLKAGAGINEFVSVAFAPLVCVLSAWPHPIKSEIASNKSVEK